MLQHIFEEDDRVLFISIHQVVLGIIYIAPSSRQLVYKP